MLSSSTAVLMIIDIQEKLTAVMHDRDSFIRQAAILIAGCRMLDIPVIWTEQYPSGLGPTIDSIASLLDGLSPIEKRAFSAMHEDAVEQAFSVFNRSQVVLCGIESHVCVWQTAGDLIGRGIETYVTADAVSSRTAANRQTGLHRIDQAGGHLTTVEMALFELLGSADHERFRDISRLVK